MCCIENGRESCSFTRFWAAASSLMQLISGDERTEAVKHSIVPRSNHLNH